MSEPQVIDAKDLKIVRAGVVVDVTSTDINIEYNNGSCSAMHIPEPDILDTIIPHITKVREYEVPDADPFSASACKFIYKMLTPYETHLFLLNKSGGLIMTASAATIPEEYDILIR